MNKPWEKRQEAEQVAAQRREAHEAEGQAILPEGCSSLEDAVVKYEGELIKRALEWAKPVKGSITRAAPLLGVTYQGLAYIIKHRHPELSDLRSNVRKVGSRKRLAS